ncbi:MAG: UTP--glucose-1-phosphate uridylyltransferase [Fuerstiella sp.]
MTATKTELLSLLQPHHQTHLLRWWDELSEDQQKSLAETIRAIDFAGIREIRESSRSDEAASADAERAGRADRAAAPKSVVFQPATPEDRERRQADALIGSELLADGRVGVITVAGGQGSRLGFEHPKGMFPIGPISERTLFQIFAEQILARRRRHGGPLPWLIMTSSATHQETVDFFQQHNFFGLGEDTVWFFQQGSMPAVDADTGQVLMADKATLCLSPDGHGGLVTALKTSGLLERLKSEGIEHLFYHQVDNPTVIICDPSLIGVHHRRESQLTTNVVKKQSPTERMGVLVDLQGRLEIIEYSELTEEQAAREDESGQWIFWAGNTAIHVFQRSFLEQLTEGRCQLELHLAHKKVPHIDEDGRAMEPEQPNANKFERFIFDALPLAANALIVEGDREREFNPVKNAEGSDSPQTARAALNRIGREWLAEAGHPVDNSTQVEISPLTALDAAELALRLSDGTVTLDQLTQSEN